MQLDHIKARLYRVSGRPHKVFDHFIQVLEGHLFRGWAIALIGQARRSQWPLWQDKIFIFLMRNAANPTDFFKIPPGRVVELGAQVTV